MKLLWICC